ncbi:hypothetical protein D9Q98_003445 [Chlorella vulgaris]|uniref:GHMP kinase N-terminal domain-containing protein n=1 Tax=Chlorella vulgaris TaxID=3077 RepID=A0A9D4YZ12_CHLVU|nr:hypothetical protein D9Q98_003445 [Chlorella vulgaris]
MAAVVQPDGSITSRVHSRIGLLGNPSDGFQGACLSLSLANYWAEVKLTPSPTLRFLPNPDCDPLEFANLQALASHVKASGYYGGLRLLQAMCKCFFEHCVQCGISLAPQSSPAFTLSYATTIPRQCGLSGSSAIVCATLNCLLCHYGVEAAVPHIVRPALVLSAEQDLGITAGLQDRVVQVHGGLVAMDFSQAGQERYQSLDSSLLPALHLIHRPAAPSGKDSGSVHSDVKRRWLEGDASVRQLMQQLAALVPAGVRALQQQDTQQLANLMQQNFILRRQIYGDAVVGAANLGMVEAAAAVGAAAKLTGSGGAVVALCADGEQQAVQLRAECQQRGLACEDVVVGPVLHWIGQDGPETR